jgi:hypothetical protein
VATYKPNIAFFEAMGIAGIDILTRLMALPRTNLWILDAKRGDIGNTAAAYASAAFDHYHSDAITVNPYLGGDSLEPFLQNPDHGAFCSVVPPILAAATSKNSSLLMAVPFTSRLHAWQPLNGTTIAMLASSSAPPNQPPYKQYGLVAQIYPFYCPASVLKVAI